MYYCWSFLSKSGADAIVAIRAPMYADANGNSIFVHDEITDKVRLDYIELHGHGIERNIFDITFSLPSLKLSAVLPAIIDCTEGSNTEVECQLLYKIISTEDGGSTGLGKKKALLLHFGGDKHEFTPLSVEHYLKEPDNEISHISAVFFGSNSPR